MATTGALPAGMGLDQDARQEYLGAMNEAMRALESRQNPNFFNIAAGFLAPTKGGSFGESLGQASAAVGKQQEDQEARALPIAQMRAQIASQKFEMQKDASMLGALAQITGMPSGGAAMQALQSGEMSMNPGMMARLAQAYPLFATSPKIAEVIKNTFSMYGDLQKNIIEEKKLGRTDAELIAKFGPGIQPMLQGSTINLSAPQQAQGQPSVAQPRPVVAPAPNQASLGAPAQGSEPDYEGQGERTGTPPIAAPVVLERPPAAAPSTGAPTPGGGSLATQQAIIEAEAKSDIARTQKEREERTAPYIEKQKALATYDYNTVKSNDAKYRELMTLVTNNPEVFGLMMKQGAIAALLQAAESGITTPVGSISADVNAVLGKLLLDPAQQAVARNAAQLIAELNQTVMKTGKSIFGPQISVYDAQQMAKPGFKETDPAAFINYLAMKSAIVNKFNGEMAQSMNDYFDRNPKATTASFFNAKNKDYARVVDDFHATYNDLISKSPFGGK